MGFPQGRPGRAGGGDRLRPPPETQINLPAWVFSESWHVDSGVPGGAASTPTAPRHMRSHAESSVRTRVAHSDLFNTCSKHLFKPATARRTELVEGADVAARAAGAAAAAEAGDLADRAVKALAGAGLPQHGLSSNKMALITSDCGTTRSSSIKWPCSLRVCASRRRRRAGRGGARGGRGEDRRRAGVGQGLPGPAGGRDGRRRRCETHPYPHPHPTRPPRPPLFCRPGCPPPPPPRNSSRLCLAMILPARKPDLGFRVRSQATSARTACSPVSRPPRTSHCR